MQKLTAETITDADLRAMIDAATVRHPPDDGERDAAWVCSRCGEHCGYRRKRPLYGYDMADAHCFTENCAGGSFCAREAFSMRTRDGRRSDEDRLNRNAAVQLATRALAGEPFARSLCAEILNARAEGSR